jgi:hypothetical protein
MGTAQVVFEVDPWGGSTGSHVVTGSDVTEECSAHARISPAFFFLL